MLSQEDILEALDLLAVPGTRESIVGKNLVRGVSVRDGRVSIILADMELRPEEQGLLTQSVRNAIGEKPELKNLEISFEKTKPVDINRVGQVIAVMSGKGGVGKSTISGLLAVSLRRRGFRVGILDADIAGPSIPRMFGVTGPLSGLGHMIVPKESRLSVGVVSMNLALEKESDPVIWRGPLISKVITQFWEETLWGKLDFLIVDLPPGTTDASLTVMQSLPITGIIIVTTPQDLVEMIVKKAVNMAKAMDKPVIGVVENMSYLLLPEMGKRIEIFGRSRGKEIAKEIGAPLLGCLPLDPELAKLCDTGNIERYDSDTVQTLGEALSRALTAKQNILEKKVR